MRKLGLVLAVSMPAMAAAQQAPSTPAADAASAPQTQEQDEGAESEEIVVTGSRKLPGAVIGDIPPDQTLGQAEIRPDVDRVLAIYPDGRVYGWHQYNDKTPERGVMD